MENAEVKSNARANFVPMWMVANEIGVAEITLYRWLRTELPEDKKAAILAAIEKLSKEVRH